MLTGNDVSVLNTGGVLTVKLLEHVCWDWDSTRWLPLRKGEEFNDGRCYPLGTMGKLKQLGKSKTTYPLTGDASDLVFIPNSQSRSSWGLKDAIRSFSTGQIKVERRRHD